MSQDTLTTALRIAMKAHDGQVDRAGKPYILHPLTVASMTDSYDAAITALLHDVMEDSDFTEKDLRSAGIPQRILDALLLLTHDKRVPYMDYVAKIKTNRLARAVKIADLTHNSDLSRLPTITDADWDRAEKYKAALSLLQS